MTRGHEIVTVGALTGPGPDAERIAARILGLVGAGVPRLSPGSDGVYGYHGLWWHRPGALPWWEARQRVGGRVSLPTFREAVDALLAGGRLIEVWLVAAGRRTPGHALALPGHAAALSRGVVRARGRGDVLAREPWAAALGAAGPAAPEARDPAGPSSRPDPGSVACRPAR